MARSTYALVSRILFLLSLQGHLLVMKGAPERIASLCKKVYTKGMFSCWLSLRVVGQHCLDGEAHRFSSKWQNRFQRAYNELGSMGERVLGFAMLELDPKKYHVRFRSFNFSYYSFC